MSTFPGADNVSPFAADTSTGTLVAPAVALTVLDLSAESAADLVGEASVTLGGVAWTLENSASMTTFAFDGSTGLDVTQAPNTDSTTATTANEIEIRATRAALGALDDDLGMIVIGCRLTAAPTGGHVTCFVRDASLSDPNAEMARVQVYSASTNVRAQTLTGGSTVDSVTSGNAGVVQLALVVAGASAYAFVSTGTTVPNAATVETMCSGVAPSGWVLIHDWSPIPAGCRSQDAWLGLGIGAGLNANTIDRLWWATRQASLA